MQSFILRTVKPKKDDVFHLFPNDEYLFFYCKGLKNLRNTIRHITPRGYRVRSAAWFSKWLRLNNYDLILSGGFITKNEKYRIIKIDSEPGEIKNFEFTNRENKSYQLKIFVSGSELNAIKMLFK